MTMEVTNRKIELKSEIHVENSDEQTRITCKSTKRPFDVAFLMLPDEKMKQKQAKICKTLEVESYKKIQDEEDDEEIEVGNNHDYKIQKFFTTQKQQIFDDPTLLKNKHLEETRPKSFIVSSEQKSAFTKVNFNKEPRLSPNLSISPDPSYQNSLSPSPPIRNYQAFPISPNQMFKSHQTSTYQNNFLPENFTPPSNVEAHFLMKTPSPEMLHPNFAKLRPMYRPDLTYNYQPEMLKIAQSPDIRSPAAAILTSLLPPSLAVLSLPAQNVCAKCNISFRMTSDLVYHMRSHHKNDSMDHQKKRREDKLKCPVCAESFRERHHLTRHMTAHQDKDEDENMVKKKEF